ncbi:MAG: hypothetical protein MUQ86_04780 [Flavobacteriaceae bacterium]|nr:hypothetical protein [Flavobacteriaceae bacterium]
MLYLCEDREKAAYQLNDFERILGEDNVLFFPSSIESLTKLKPPTMQMYCCDPKF